MHHFQAKVLKWTETDKGNIERRIGKARENVRHQLEEKSGLRLYQVNSSGSKQGTSTNGKQGKQFLSEKYRLSVMQCVPKQYQGVLKKILHQLSIILRVVSSTSTVHIEFQQKCVDFATLIATELPWDECSMTCHSLIFCSTELIVCNMVLVLDNFPKHWNLEIKM